MTVSVSIQVSSTVFACLPQHDVHSIPCLPWQMLCTQMVVSTCLMVFHLPLWLCMQVGHSKASRAVVTSRNIPYNLKQHLSNLACCRPHICHGKGWCAEDKLCQQYCLVHQPFADILHVTHHCKWHCAESVPSWLLQASTNRYDLPNAPLVMQLHRPVRVTLPKPMTENVHIAFPPLPMEHGQHEIVVALRLKLPMLPP